MNFPGDDLPSRQAIPGHPDEARPVIIRCNHIYKSEPRFACLKEYHDFPVIKVIL
jgi:hypothetical protein